MGLKNWFDALFQAPSIAELSRQLAQRSYALAREAVGSHVLSFSRAEARGYVRAKAAPIIRFEARLLASRHPGLSAAKLATAVAHASDRVVQSVLTDLNRERTRQIIGRAA